jgi:SAM-dependent methyltransferase
MSAPECRTCHSTRTAKIGSLPDVFEFAGRRYDQPLRGGFLWRCAACGFVFRHPIHDAGTYAELYRNGSSHVWESNFVREDFRLIRRYIEQVDVTDILDIGCYTGKLLSTLPKRCRLNGVEVNRAAGQVAVGRGVRILAESFEELSEINEDFDLVIVCDVIEHVIDPLAFMKGLRSHLRAGGQLIISTGDAESWLWRLIGSRYWYCHFPEHISFLSKSWFKAMAGAAGFEITGLRSFNYHFGFLRSPVLMLAALAYAASPAMTNVVRKLMNSELSESSAPPGCGATKDHVLCVLSAI